MFPAVTPLLILLAAAAVYVRADPNPNNPGPGDVFIQGKSCTLGWDVDSTGLWKTMQIDLMTGDNFNMVFLTTVGTVDGTNPSMNTFSFTCPQVTPHSPIYFYQFSSPSASNKTWTGRFTITDSANDIVAPSQSTQPDGEKIPWGTGALVNGTSAAASSTSGTPVVTSSGTPTTSSMQASTTSSSDTFTPTVVYVTTDVVSTTPSTSTVATAGTNGAATTLSISNVVLQTGVALVLAAFGFTVMF